MKVWKAFSGSLTEYKIEYNITQDFLGLLGVIKVIGSKDHPDGEQYQFNKMEISPISDLN